MPPTCSIFIRTYPADFAWLELCLRSIDRFVDRSSVMEIVIHVDPGTDLGPARLGARDPAGIPLRVVTSPVTCFSGYINQQVAKLRAWEWCHGDLIWYVDSDCIFRRLCGPASQMTPDGRIKMLMTPWALVGDAECWREPTERILGWPADYEFMRRLPLLYWRGTVRGLHDWNQGIYGTVAAQTKVSEFNLLGSFARKCDAGNYDWLDTSLVPESEWPETVAHQFWSWGGVTPEVRRRVEELLK